MNKNFIILEELKSIIIKVLSSNDIVTKEIEKMGEVKMLALAGLFVEQATTTVDMLLVGDVNKERFTEYINNELRTKRPVKFTIMSEEDYKYRLNCNDKFIKDIVNSPQSQIPINKLD